MRYDQIERQVKDAAQVLGAIALLAISVMATAMNAADLDPQFDKAMRSAVRQYPQLVEGSARDGYYAVRVVARADGTLHTSSLSFLGPPPGLPAAPDMEVRFAKAIEGPAIAKIRKGQQIAAVGKAANNIHVTWYVLPEDFDESRDVRRVADAVRAQYADPMRPTRAPGDPTRAPTEMNLLTIFMNEDGLIARRAMEPISIAGMQSMNPRPLNTSYFGASAFTPPPVAVEAFRVLGLEPAEIGQTGLVLVERSNPELARSSGDLGQQVQQLLRHVQYGPAVLVRYAWPRRPGEPIGGKAPVSPVP